MMDNGLRVYREKELIFTAYKRCCCGAGLAYPKTNKDPYFYWGCSYVLMNDLKFRAATKPTGPFDTGTIESEDGIIHDGGFSFVFHELQMENEKVSTRPKQLVKVKTQKKQKKKEEKH